MPAPSNTHDTLTPTNEFHLSIEPIVGKSFLHFSSLGNDEATARHTAEAFFKKSIIDIRTVALMLNGKVHDVYDGQWNSEIDTLSEPEDEPLPEIHNVLKNWFTLPIDDAGTPYVPTSQTREDSK